MAGYTKLWSDIVHSTIWREASHVRLVWITMLAISDREGYVGASLPGLADAARVTVDEARDALDRLQQPDPDSRSKVLEGRRLTEADGGWTIVNYAYHREREAGERRRVQVREAVRRHRAKKKAKRVSDYRDDGKLSNRGKPMHRADASSYNSSSGGFEILTPEGNNALLWLAERSGNPEAFRSEVGMILQGGRANVPGDPESVSLGLVDLVLDGKKPNALMLRGFIRKAHEERQKGRDPAGDLAEVDRLIAEERSRDDQG